MLSILYVDDDPYLRDLTHRYLERSKDVQGDLAADVASGPQMKCSKGYDAIVSDYEIPGQDGIFIFQ